MQPLKIRYTRPTRIAFVVIGGPAVDGTSLLRVPTGKRVWSVDGLGVLPPPLLVEVVHRPGAGPDPERLPVTQGLGEPAACLPHGRQPSVVAGAKGGDRRAERAAGAVRRRRLDPRTAQRDWSVVEPEVDRLRACLLYTSPSPRD